MTGIGVPRGANARVQPQIPTSPEHPDLQRSARGSAKCVFPRMTVKRWRGVRLSIRQSFRWHLPREPTAVMCTPRSTPTVPLGVGLAGQHAIGSVQTPSTFTVTAATRGPFRPAPANLRRIFRTRCLPPSWTHGRTAHMSAELVRWDEPILRFAGHQDFSASQKMNAVRGHAGDLAHGWSHLWVEPTRAEWKPASAPVHLQT